MSVCWLRVSKNAALICPHADRRFLNIAHQPLRRPSRPARAIYCSGHIRVKTYTLGHLLSYSNALSSITLYWAREQCLRSSPSDKRGSTLKLWRPTRMLRLRQRSIFKTPQYEVDSPLGAIGSGTKHKFRVWGCRGARWGPGMSIQPAQKASL